jgi:KilA-N domain
MAKKIISVEGFEVTLINQSGDDYISLTDIARRANERTDIVISNWLRNRNTIEFLGAWEILSNPNFNPIEFDGIKQNAGLNAFVLTSKQWIEKTNAIGITSKAGKYGGTYAHTDIALEFCSWISPVFKLFLTREFQRLKAEEAKNKHLEADWNLKRMLSKVNYRFHTDAIRHHLVPPRVENTKSEGLYFASEADLLNMAVFGLSAKNWREANPDLKGNIRDNATAEQLLVLANLENLNAEFIHQGLSKQERLLRLNEIAIYQMEVLVEIAPTLPSFLKGTMLE